MPLVFQRAQDCLLVPVVVADVAQLASGERLIAFPVRLGELVG
jgi:hypothetical protein